MVNYFTASNKYSYYGASLRVRIDLRLIEKAFNGVFYRSINNNEKLKELKNDPHLALLKLPKSKGNVSTTSRIWSEQCALEDP